MDNLKIEQTKSSLAISLNAESGIISMSGNSYPENSATFFQPIMLWLREYFSGKTPALTIINMEIIYFNSSSSRQFYEFFDLLNHYIDQYKIQINWIYDNENDSAEEAGEDFVAEFEKLNIQLVAK